MEKMMILVTNYLRNPDSDLQVSVNHKKILILINSQNKILLNRKWINIHQALNPKLNIHWIYL